MKTHCRQWVCGHCDCLGISLIFRLTTFDVRIRRQKSSNSANRVFYIPLNKGYFGKAIFYRLFPAWYHILKKKKNRYWAYVAVVLIITLSILATCLFSSNCSVTHGGRALPQCCFNDGPHFQRSGDVETVLFQCITLITFGILEQTSQNVRAVATMAANSVCKITCKTVENWLRYQRKTLLRRCHNVGSVLCSITFEVLNQTPPNLLGSCRSSSRWCLQNYMKNGRELTSELTSEWIYIWKYSSKFHTNLINNFLSNHSNFTKFTGQSP